jgi:hypothetical protein
LNQVISGYALATGITRNPSLAILRRMIEDLDMAYSPDTILVALPVKASMRKLRGHRHPRMGNRHGI